MKNGPIKQRLKVAVFKGKGRQTPAGA